MCLCFRDQTDATVTPQSIDRTLASIYADIDAPLFECSSLVIYVNVQYTTLNMDNEQHRSNNEPTVQQCQLISM